MRRFVGVVLLMAFAWWAVPALAATITGSNANDVLHGTPQADSIDGGNGSDVVHADAGDDHVIGGNDDDELHGEAGNDHLEDSNGNDELSGGVGRDRLEGGNGTDLLDGADGHDLLDGGNGDETISGGAGDDDALGGNGTDQFAGGAGHDSFDGDLGNDTGAGGAGLDVLYADQGNDGLTGEGDSDVLVGLSTSGNPVLDGGDLGDVLAGGRGALRGGDGDDVIFGYANASIDGGAGTDTCYRTTGISVAGCETVIALGSSSSTPSLAIQSGPADHSVVTGASASFAFQATGARGVWCVTSTGTVADCSSGTFSVSGLGAGDHAVAFIAPANGAKTAAVGIRRFTVELPAVGIAIDSASSPVADTLELSARNLASAHRFRAQFEDGGVASWLTTDARITVDPDIGAPSATVRIVDPNLGRETVTRVEVLDSTGAVLASRDVDVDVATSVSLADAASNAPGSVTITGEALDVLDRVVLVHSGGSLSIDLDAPGVFVGSGQIIITSSALDGLQISQIDAVIAVDGAEVLASIQVDVTIATADRTPPAIETPGEIEVEATSPTGATVEYAVTAIDAVDGEVDVDCTPASGGTFALGETTVDCESTDAAGNDASESFVVRVRDTTGPAITLPAPIEAGSDHPLGATVSFDVSAIDAVDGPTNVSCDPHSGSVFALGTTTVTCTATDARGNVSSGTFHVTIHDAQAPVLMLPATLVLEATSVAGAPAAFNVTATDAVDGDLDAHCDRETGTVFALGHTTVACQATDAAGNVASGSFVVRVQDTTGPAIVAPETIEASATSSAGAEVTFDASASDLVDGTVLVTCAPASGSVFALGVTSVMCVASDVRGNSSTGSFDVIVQLDPLALSFDGATDQFVADPAGGPIYFDVQVHTELAGDVQIVCDPASGSAHPVGPLDVHCDATDAHGNTATLDVQLNVIYREPFAHADATISEHLPEVWAQRYALNLPMSTVQSLVSPTKMVLRVDDGEGGTMPAVAHGLFGYETADGGVAPIDTTLRARAGGGYSPRAVGYDAVLPESFAAGTSMGLAPRVGGGVIQFKPRGTRADAPAARVVHGADHLLYPSVWTDTDVVTTPHADRVAEHVIVKSANAPQMFSWIVDHPTGTTLAVTDAGLEVEAVDGSKQLVVPGPTAVDASGQLVPTAYELSTVGGVDVLTLAWSEVPDDGDTMVYPIAIDPPQLGPHQYVSNVFVANDPVVYSNDGGGVERTCDASTLDVRFVGREWVHETTGATHLRRIETGSEAGCTVTGPRDGERWYFFGGTELHWGFSTEQVLNLTDEDGSAPTIGGDVLSNFVAYGVTGSKTTSEPIWSTPTGDLTFRLSATSGETLGLRNDTEGRPPKVRVAWIKYPVAVFVDDTAPEVAFTPETWPSRVSPVGRDIYLAMPEGDGSGCAGGTITVTRISTPGSTTSLPFSGCTASTTLPDGTPPGDYSVGFSASDIAGNTVARTKYFTIIDPIVAPKYGADAFATVDIKTELLDDLPDTHAILQVTNNETGEASTLFDAPAHTMLGVRSTAWNTLSVPNGEYTITLDLEDGRRLSTKVVRVSNDLLMGQHPDLSSSSITGGLTATHANGNVTLHKVDASIPALGVTLEMSRTYNSQLPGTGTLGRANWRAGFEQQLVVGDHGYVRYVDPTGLQYEYEDHGGGTFDRAPGLEADLTRDAGGSFSLRANNGTIQRFDAQGRWSGTSTPNGNDVHVSRDVASRVQRIYDDSGLGLDFGYDAAGRLVSVEDPAIGIARYFYDSAGDLITYRDVTGAEWTYHYNANNNLDSVKSPIATTPARVNYNQDGLDEAGNAVDGTVKSLVDAVGNTTHLEYDFAASTVRVPVTAPAGAPSTAPAFVYTIGNGGRCVFTVTPNPSSETITYTYDAQLRLLWEEESDPKRTTYTYDSRGNVLTETVIDTAPPVPADPARLGPLVTTYSGYNSFGQPTHVTDPKNNTTVSTYDSRGNLTSQRMPGNGLTQYEYDGAGLMRAMVDAKDRRTEYTYDSHGWLTDTLNPDLTTTHATYDANGNVLTSTDENTEVVRYVRDAAGRALSVTDESQRTTSSTYNGEGDPLTTTNGVNGVTRNTYDANGNLLSSLDPMNRPTSYTYDEYGNQKTMTNANLKTWHSTYDAHGNLRSERDPLNFETVHDYDGEGRRITTIEPGNAITHYTYDHASNLLTSTDPDGNVTTYQYYPDGSVKREINGEGDVTEFVYDPNGNTQTRTNPDNTMETSVYDAADQLTNFTSSTGVAESFGYDLRGRQDTATNPAGSSATGYDAVGRAESITNANQHTTEYGFDEAGRLTTQTNPDGGVVTLVYDDAGETIGAIDARQKATSIERDLSGRMTRMNHPDGTYTTYQYDPAGNLTETRVLPNSNPYTGVSKFTYDAANQIRTARTETGDEYTFTYDGRGNVATQVKNFVFSTTYTHTGANRLKTITNSGQTSTFTYDNAGRLKRRVTPVGTIDYTYLNGKLKTVVDSVSGTTTYAYDALGRVQSQTEPKGTTSYSYDPAGRVEVITRPGNNISTYGYDAIGNVTSIESAHGEQSIEYDSSERPKRATNPDGEVDYTYDTQDHVKTANVYGKSYAYDYDSRGRMQSQTLPDGSTSHYEYTNAGFLKKVTHGNGDVTSYTYDNNERLQGVTSDSGFSRSYSYYSSGNLGSASNPTGPTQAYSFYEFSNNNTGALQNFYSDNQDFIDQHYYQYGGVQTALLFVRPRTNATPSEIPTAFRQLVLGCMNVGACTDPDVAAAMRKFQAINPDTDRSTYTDIENRVAQVLWNYAPARYVNTMNPATGRLTSREDRIAGTTSTFSYDNAGNVSEREVKRTSDNLPLYEDRLTFDSRDRLTLFTKVAGGASSNHPFAYDDQGRITRMDDGLRVLRYDLNGRLVQENISGTEITYAYNPLGLESMTLTTGSNGPATYYYEYNTHGDVIHLVDSAGDIAATYHYDAWGNQRTEGPTALINNNRFTYAARTGAMYVRQTGMYYMGIRWYDPTQQRFISEDPAGTDPNTHANTYAYANNNPITNIDATGLTARPMRSISHTPAAPIAEPVREVPVIPVPVSTPDVPRQPAVPLPPLQNLDPETTRRGEYRGPDGHINYADIQRSARLVCTVPNSITTADGVSAIASFTLLCPGSIRGSVNVGIEADDTNSAGVKWVRCGAWGILTPTDIRAVTSCRLKIGRWKYCTRTKGALWQLVTPPESSAPITVKVSSDCEIRKRSA